MVYDLLNQGVLLRVRLMPNSSSCRLNGVFCDAEGQEFLKVCVVSVPEKGKANKELLGFIAKKLNVSKSQCEIVAGELDRYKKIKISGIADEIIVKLEEWISGDENVS